MDADLKALLPWPRVVAYLAPKDLCAVRLASRFLCETSKPFFSPEDYAALVSDKFVRALLDKRVTKKVRRFVYITG